MRRFLCLFLLLPSLLAGAAVAAVPAATEQTIRQALAKSRPDLAVAGVEASPVENLFAVRFERGPVVYATADGRHFVLGDLFRVEPAGFVNVAELARNKHRAELLTEIKPADTIVFSAQGETKAVLHVFTDVDCIYCQTLHQQMSAYNARGIEIRYLAFPRAGIGSDSYRKIASAWCADDPRAALTRLKSRQSIAIDVCEDNPVAAQYELAARMGVEGTPALITTDGTLLPGYMPPEQLAQALGIAAVR